MRKPIITTAIETVTPRRAEAYLRANKQNRTPRSSYVASLARDMATGRWRFNGEPLIFSADGTLMDGQHRLMAVLESNTPVQLLVVRGVAPDAFASIDCGRSRTAGDVFKIEGVKNYSTVAAAAHLLWRHRNGGLSGAMTPTTAERVDIKTSDPGLLDALDYVLSGDTRVFRRIIPPSFMAFFLYCAREVDSHKADLFVDGLKTGDGLTKRSPVKVLRERLIENSSQINGKSLGVTPQRYLVFAAWRGFRDGRQMIKLQLPKRGTEGGKVFRAEHFEF